VRRETRELQGIWDPRDPRVPKESVDPQE